MGVDDNYLGKRAACVSVGSAAPFRPARTNNPAASTANEDHQKKYPIPRPIPHPFQCALKTKATAAAHAEKRLSARVPRNITHGEPMTKSSDVSTLRIASGASYPVPRLPGITALSAMTKASKPLIVGPILPPPRPVTTGRDQAETLRSQASAIRRFDLLTFAPPRCCIRLRDKYMQREWVIVDKSPHELRGCSGRLMMRVRQLSPGMSQMRRGKPRLYGESFVRSVVGRITAVTSKSPRIPLLLTVVILPPPVCARAVADFL